MELILILIGCLAMVGIGLMWAGFGALGESMPAFLAGLGLAATGIGFAAKKILEAFGVDFTTIDFSISIGNGFISVVACAIIGIVGVIAIVKIVMR